MRRYAEDDETAMGFGQDGEWVRYADVEPLLAEVKRLRRFRDAAVPVCKWVDSDRPPLDYSTHKMRARRALAILEAEHADH